jgi:hypothetical protein
MLDDLLNHIDDPDLEDDVYVRLESASWQADDLSLGLVVWAPVNTSPTSVHPDSVREAGSGPWCSGALTSSRTNSKRLEFPRRRPD